MQGSLAGLKVLEVATFIAGPYCTMMLGDHGADVIKIERPDGGDENRDEPPFMNGESAPFMLWNRNKRSVVLDLKSKSGHSNFLALAHDVDVVVENLRPGAMERLGLGYEDLSARNRRLIYATVSGYGRSGPLSMKGGFDLVLQGFSGLMALNGPEDGPPFRLPIPICDIVAGGYLLSAVLLALRARERTGKGQFVETSLLETALSLQQYEAASYFATGKRPERLGQRHRGVAPYQVFAAADGHLTIGIAHQRFWYKFCDVIGSPELAANPQYANNADRVRRAYELARDIEKVLKKRPRRYWIELLDAVGIPSGPILTIDEALEHPQTTARDMVISVNHPTVGGMRTLGTPIKLTDTPGAVRRPAPLLGEHSAEATWRGDT